MRVTSAVLPGNTSVVEMGESCRKVVMRVIL